MRYVERVVQQRTLTWLVPGALRGAHGAAEDTGDVSLHGARPVPAHAPPGRSQGALPHHQRGRPGGNTTM